MGQEAEESGKSVQSTNWKHLIKTITRPICNNICFLLILCLFGCVDSSKAIDYKATGT